MLGVQDAPLVARECVVQLAVHVQLVLRPERARLEERSEAARCDGEVRLEDPLELEERLIVESDAREIVRRDPSGSEAVVDRVRGEARVALLSCEALFLRGRDDLAIAQQARRAVVVKRGDAEDVGQLRTGHCRVHLIPTSSRVARCTGATRTLFNSDRTGDCEKYRESL